MVGTQTTRQESRFPLGLFNLLAVLEPDFFGRNLYFLWWLFLRAASGLYFCITLWVILVKRICGDCIVCGLVQCYLKICFQIIFSASRKYLTWFQRVGRRLIFGKGYQMQDTNTTDNKNKVIKFKESAWKCIYFLSAEFLALYVTSKEPWFNNTRHFWVGPGDQVWPDQKIKLKLKGLYMYAAGFYTYSIFALIFWETRRSDFGVLMGHHFATVTLVVLSYIFRFGRVGSVVLAIHDASDVFLEIGKMSKYCGAEKLASIAFIIFVLSWILLRLIYFPFWVLWSTSYEVVQTLDKEKHPVVGPICYYLFNTLLFCLLVLHIYWWVLMYRMLVNQIQAGGKISEDVRSGKYSIYI
ncbi:hypothetical protein Goari_006912, partial [Gossypium aridum]|nr:hypothetical protein [Gossypium aridum]